MSNSATEICRLCSSSTNLVSLFHGKSRAMRDGLRKMIQETIHIQIEEKDPLTIVCFNCLVDVSNFYFFKLHCLQNEEKIKEIAAEVPKAKRVKRGTLALEEIDVPDIGLTEEILRWLLAKRLTLIDVQKRKSSTDKDCQCNVEQASILTQTDSLNTTSSYSQTSNVLLDDKYVQVCPSNKFASTQIEKVETENRYSQTSVHFSKQTKPKVVSNNALVHNIKLSPEVNDRGTQCDIKYSNSIKENGRMSEMNSQTSLLETVSVGTQCELFDTYSYFIRNSHLITSTSNSLAREKDCKVNFKNVCYKEEKLSPLEGLTVSISPDKADELSPNMADLLQVQTDKSDSLEDCKICYTTLYKHEIFRHKKTHMICKFCKRKFKSVRNTQRHIANCRAQQLQSLPFVYLVKVENEPEFRKRYPNAFHML